MTTDDYSHLSDDELITLYNATPKPNDYGHELLRRIHLRDQHEFGMSADNPRLYRR